MGPPLLWLSRFVSEDHHMARSEIVGRSRATIVGGRVADYQELMDYSTGEDPGAPMMRGPGGHHFHRRGQPVAYMRGAYGPAVHEEHPTHPREFPIGFSTESGSPVPAAQTLGVQTLPQVLFRGERLAVPNSIVLNFQLADIKVGKDSQLAAPGNMPAECFSNISVGVRMQLDTAEPGITITLFVANVDESNPHPFASCLFGTVIE
jgi:hypothetical protein